MFPLLALAVPTILETIVAATATTVVTHIAMRVTDDAYNAATKTKKDDDEE
ncbi:MAG: hypothetical protein JSR69_20445 [Proteobacteria bacterium]|nr:hypothetical protein [Pseudomonadota bacterium]